MDAPKLLISRSSKQCVMVRYVSYLYLIFDEDKMNASLVYINKHSMFTST